MARLQRQTIGVMSAMAGWLLSSLSQHPVCVFPSLHFLSPPQQSSLLHPFLRRRRTVAANAVNGRLRTVFGGIRQLSRITL